MPEGGTPFEDGPPPVSATPAVEPARAVPPPAGEASTDTEPPLSAPSASAQGPQPGSSEEAALLALVFGTGASEGSSVRADRRRRNLAIMTIFIAIAAVVGLVLGASYLRHVAATTTSSGPAAVHAHSESEQNVLTALGAAVAYESSHPLSTVSLAAHLTAAEPSLSFPIVSGGPAQVAVAVPAPGAVVLTSFQPTPAACVGALQVVSAQSAPVFSDDPATASRGTYYFEAPASSGLCNALGVTPPGSNYISAEGFPTARLP